jgi:hypothetical protein
MGIDPEGGVSLLRRRKLAVTELIYTHRYRS